MVTDTTPTTAPTGPLPLHVLGAPPSVDHAKAASRIGRHGSSDALLPARVFDKLDAARDTFLAARLTLAGRLTDLVQQRISYRREDLVRQAELDQAARSREPAPEDSRTPEVQRRARLDALNREAWSAVLPLAAELDAAVDLARDHEARWLEQLRDRLPGVRAERKRAAAVLAEADLQERTLSAIWCLGAALRGRRRPVRHPAAGIAVPHDVAVQPHPSQPLIRGADPSRSTASRADQDVYTGWLP